MQVKGVMPLPGGLTHETPTGRAVGRYKTWHNIFFKVKAVYALQILECRDCKAKQKRKVMPYPDKTPIQKVCINSENLRKEKDSLMS